MLFRFVRWIYPKLENVSPKLAEAFAIEIFLRPLRPPLSEKGKKALASAELFDIDLNGKKLQGYKWKNDGPTILLVHGWSSHGLQFHSLIKKLHKNGFEVISYDNWGHGKSGGNKSNVVLMKDAVTVISERHNIQGVVSHSLGAAAAIWAEKQNSLKLKTVAIAPPVTAREIMSTFMSKIKARKDILPAASAYTQKYFDDPFPSFTLEHLTKEIHEFPLLIIHDKKDRDSPVSESLLLKEKLPFANLHITEKLGHNRILHDEEVAKEIMEFLN